MSVGALEAIERRGRVMGTTYHLVAVNRSDTQLDRVVARLGQLEQRWSRFLPSSEISAINAAPDRFHLVSADTALLITRGIQAWEMTDGACDPTVLDALIGMGYDRSFEQLHSERRPTPARSTDPASGCGQMQVDQITAETFMVTLGDRVGFDPGGIGKGTAADIVLGELLADVSPDEAGAMVNIGGDVVCRGLAPTENGWVIEVREPTVASEPIACLAVADGAVATSTTRKRSWRVGDEGRHHVIDPSSGLCTDELVLASVLAAQGWMAEALATQLLVSGDLTAIDDSLAGAVVIDRDGERHATRMIRAFSR